MLITLFVSFGVLMLLGVPLAFSVGIASLLAILVKQEVSLFIIAQKLFQSLDSFPLMAVPLFILTGKLMNIGGVTRRIINLSKQGMLLITSLKLTLLVLGIESIL